MHSNVKLNFKFLASKKGVSSTKNGRDSESKRLGAKPADGQFVTGGSILYHNIRIKTYLGENVGLMVAMIHYSLK